MINNGVPENCCDKNYIDKAAPYYNMTLKNSGFNNNITYISCQTKKNLKRKIIWV